MHFTGIGSTAEIPGVDGFKPAAKVREMLLSSDSPGRGCKVRGHRRGLVLHKRNFATEADLLSVGDRFEMPGSGGGRRTFKILRHHP